MLDRLQALIAWIPGKVSDFTHLKHPWVMLLFVIALIGIIILIRKNFVTFKNEEEKKAYMKKRRLLRIFVTLARSIALLCLFIALATPFTLNEETVQGDMSIVIMADNSTSFELYDTGLAAELKEKLEMSFPAQLKYIARGNTSPIAEGLLGRLKGDDNILLVSDGNNNHGKSLRDVALTLANLNATINAVQPEPLHSDTGIVIKGPDKAVRGTELSFAAEITQAGKERPYHVTIELGHKKVVDEDGTGSQSYTFSRKLGEGYHKITAEVIPKGEQEDYFKANNKYYKTVEILPRPKTFMWSGKESYFYSFMTEIFNFAREKELPSDLSGYSAVLMNDISISQISGKDYEGLVDFVLNGSGLVVYGGENSYEKGGYASSLFERMLPVKIRAAETDESKEEKINIVIVMDISDSTGSLFSTQGGESKVDVEKSLAISLLDYIKDESQVGIAAFNSDAYTVWPLSPLDNSYDLEDRISRLRDGGGTDISAGIRKAAGMLEGAKGSNNMIIISDGVTRSPSDAVKAAESAREKGISTFTVGVGGDTSEITLKNIASAGGGHYYRPKQSERLKILFGEPEQDDTCNDERKKVVIMEPNHFVTEGLEVDAVLTGHNYVAPKSTANVLIATCDGKPVITAWRYGLGRVVAVSTDDGSSWSGELLSAKNSELITRMINWAIGDPTRNNDFDVDVSDTNIGEPVKVTVRSEKEPKSDLVDFSKVDKRLYEGTFTPGKTGFYDFFGSLAAVNYIKELEKTGFNNDIKGIVRATGGEVFRPDDIKGIINKTKSVSTRREMTEKSLRWPFLAAAIIIFLIEIAVRRISEMR